MTRSNLLRPYSFFLALLTVSWTMLDGNEVSAQGRRVFRQNQLVRETPAQHESPVAVPGLSGRTAEAAELSDEQLIQKLTEACAQAKEAFRTPTDKDIADAGKRLLRAAVQLEGTLRRAADRENACIWRERLNLDALLATLRRAEGPDPGVLSAASLAFNGNFATAEGQDPAHINTGGVNWEVFAGVRKELRCLDMLYTVRTEKWANLFRQHCDEFPGHVKAYMENGTAQNAERIGATITWFDDLGNAFLPEALPVVALLQGALKAENCRVSASGALVTAGFARELHEEFRISDTIFDTRVSGDGVIDGRVSATLVPNADRAEIGVAFESQMHSKTVGRNGPVTLSSETNGTIVAEKPLRIGAKKIETSPATVHADLKTRTTGLHIDGGQIVQCIAKKQIAAKQPRAQAEARRRAERRAAERIDDELAERLAELNERFVTAIHEPLKNLGLMPAVWNFASTEGELTSALTLAAPLQPTTRVPARELEKKSDVHLQIHQSLFNNFAEKALAGKTFKQVELEKEMEKRFGKTPEFFVDKTGEEPWTVEFSRKTPLRVEFKDGCVNITLSIVRYYTGELEKATNRDSFGIFGVPEKQTPDLEISVTYRIGFENGKAILELADSPKVGLRNPNLPVENIMFIRSKIAKRIENQEEKRKSDGLNVIKPIELKGDWDGHALGLEQAVVGDHGWFTLGWKFD